MAKPTKIGHPLKTRRGASQRKRVLDALRNDAVKIDASTLVDRLQMISQYAKRVNHYQAKLDNANEEYLEINDWTPFFEKSLPFQLAQFSKISKDEIESTYLALDAALAANVSTEHLESLLKYVYAEVIHPITQLYKTVSEAENTLSAKLASILDSARADAIGGYIKLHNASSKYLCIPAKSFTHFLQEPWKISASVIYEYDLDVSQVTGGKRAAILLVKDRLSNVFYQLLSRLQLIIEAAPNYIEESLDPLEAALQKQHAPHLALLFTFLQLFEHFQGDLNALTEKHLDFFYQQVLQIQPKDAVADRAHLILEIANHLEQYPLKAGLQFKNGKDVNGEDIIFELDDEIIIDKTKLTDLKSLYLNAGHLDDSFEGEYKAPIANSKDGQGVKFKPTDAANWASLGAKDSKLLETGTENFQAHPAARIGFVLASPVLLLQEGKRTITFKIDCEVNTKKDWADAAMQVEVITKCLGNKFYDPQCRYWINPSILDCDLSDSAKNYLTELLAQQSPYLSEQDKDDFRYLKEELSCQPIFLESDLDCFVSPNFVEATDKTVYEPLFHIGFSGKEAWVQPKLDTNHVALTVFESPAPPAPSATLTESYVTFEIVVALDADDPAVVFYDEAILQESLDLKTPFPAAKIELNSNYKLSKSKKSTIPDDIKELLFPPTEEEAKCCLHRSTIDKQVSLSTYTLFKDLVIHDVTINVEVCGVKNLIVQNDENIQDVNSPILPFGTRPKVGGLFEDGAGNDDWFVDGGSNFYIGSKEIFCKNWETIWINTNWKDKPLDLEKHYKFYDKEPFEDGSTIINEESFKFVVKYLEDGDWLKDDINKLAYSGIPEIVNSSDLYMLFKSKKDAGANPCSHEGGMSTYCHAIAKSYFPDSDYVPKSMPLSELSPLNITSRKGFIQLTMAGISFQHDRYTYVLSEQMMALADLLAPQAVELAVEKLELSKILCLASSNRVGAIKNNINFIIDHFNNEIFNALDNNSITSILAECNDLHGFIDNVLNNVNATANLNLANNSIQDIIARIGSTGVNGTLIEQLEDIKQAADSILNTIVLVPGGYTGTIPVNDITGNVGGYGLEALVVNSCAIIDEIITAFGGKLEKGIPNEPYTPTIKSLCIDYKATAAMDDMDIIHLYPFEKTSRWEDIEQAPTLVPSHNHEGTLYIGLEQLTPGNNLNLLFQLAEATADSEADEADLKWSYLSNNVWLPLREGFEVLSDATDGLTVSGIVTLAIPDNITDKGNTIMPVDKYWIRVAAEDNVAGVAEAISVFVQAVSATASLSETNDKERLDTPLPAESVAKLVDGDFAVKKIEQPFASFDGRPPELSGHYYTRVSEQLRHKGRGKLAFDYERLVLEAFPNIYKVKCISHTMWLSANDYRRDLEVAPGFVVITVIPDLKKLAAGNTLEPKAPVSLLEKIESYLKNRISPFARLKVANPRYEKVDVTISVRLIKGKSEKYYANQLKEAIIQFLAPWYLGDSEKISFGQQVLFSDIVGFVEKLDYVDFIQNLKLEGECKQGGSIIRPLTARSILTGGKICVTINKDDCKKKKVPDKDEDRDTVPGNVIR